MDDELDKWRDGVDRTILATLASVAAAMIPVGAASHDITQAIADAAEGGKRLRSILLLASHHAHGGSAPRSAIALGAALELFHTGALLHDDILDESDTRRGRPSAHRHFASHHREKGWEGDPLAFGNAGAILAGDVALMAADRALHAATSALSGTPRDRVASLFHDTVDLVVAGQYLDMRIATQPVEALAHQEADIRTTMRAKTAAYTGEAPLALGAASAGMDDAKVEAIRDAGVYLGLAFQLRDDILGLSGDPAVTGKPAGEDIREGKRTLLMWHAWARASSAQRAALRRALGVRTASDGEVSAAIDVARTTGAFEAVEKEIGEASLQAQTRIRGLGLEEPYATLLVKIAADAADRDR
ncbi:MAG: polyprenyl synthetase family protein [Demequinaceae bacterium]|nr:polyprenyl synthetase family protein [Demequinaceae bacterium]